MSEFQELIKNFSKCRDFFVYGFKSRSDFPGKSGRTYDDERRWIESWLSEYVKTDYGTGQENTSGTGKGRVKNISLQMDSNLLNTNPLYRVWKTKSFTDNDILLHFFLLDILDNRVMSVNEITDEIITRYDMVLDSQMIRRKCNEYVKEGLLTSEKSGKTLLYGRGPDWQELTSINNSKSGVSVFCPDTMLDAMRFYQLSAPFGIIGSTILDNQKTDNSLFRIKHSFLIHTLEDEITLLLLRAMRGQYILCLFCQSNKNQTMRKEWGVPLQFFVSTHTGRRYICVYRTSNQRFHCIRLDQIKKIEFLDIFPDYEQIRKKIRPEPKKMICTLFTGQNPVRRVFT